MSNEVWTIGRIQDWGAKYLDSKGFENSKRQIDLILSQVMNFERIDLYVKFDLPLNQFELNEVKDKIKRIVSHEPIQYILGEVEFYNLKFKVNNNVLIPRPETEELVDLIVKENQSKNQLNILDIGCGSGCIGISLAKNLPNSKVFAIDISEGAIETSKVNAVINGVENIEFFILDILMKIPKTKFDVIVSNPPYISKDEFHLLDNNVKEYEPRVALTDEGDGLMFFRRFYAIFSEILNVNGVFYFENSFEQGKKLNESFKKKFNITNYTDINGIERFLKGELKNSEKQHIR